MNEPLILSLEDLVQALIAGGMSQREALLQIKRELENEMIVVIDPHRDPCSKQQVLKWQCDLLQSLANWRPGARPPAMLIGAPEYLSHLRYVRIEQKAPTRSNAGSPPQFDWEDAEMFVMKLLQEKGDPKKPENQGQAWRTNTDIAKAVLDYLQKRAKVTREKVPDFNTVRNKVPGWLQKFRALN
jgi:hypothetical protein